MSWKEWLDNMLGRPRPAHDEVKQVILDRTEVAQADRLSKLTGRRRDEVLSEAYRRADERRRATLRAESESYRRQPR